MWSRSKRKDYGQGHRRAACRLIAVLGSVALAAREASVGANAIRTALEWPERSVPSHRRRIVAAAARMAPYPPCRSGGWRP